MAIRKKTLKRPVVITISVISLTWLMLTLWVERKGPAKTWHKGGLSENHKALIVFDPDPIYNLDEQLCESLAEGLATKDYNVTIATVAAAEKISGHDFSLFVFCANTYNWTPDWAISNYIKSSPQLRHKKVVAITLGAGSTGFAQQALEKLLKESGANIIQTKTWWLMRPNDESRLSEDNVKVARSIAYQTGIQLTDSIGRNP